MNINCEKLEAWKTLTKENGYTDRTLTPPSRPLRVYGCFKKIYLYCRRKFSVCRRQIYFVSYSERRVFLTQISYESNEGVWIGDVCIYMHLSKHNQ